MLGQHPDLYSAPELNVFSANRLADFYDRLPPQGTHGLLRTLAQLYTGEQTLESIDTARRWIYRRARWTPEETYQEICRHIAPRRLVDKCTSYTNPQHPMILQRLCAAYPDARYIHLVRHPLAQCRSWLKSPYAIQQLAQLGSIDRSGVVATVDPQFDWLHRNTGIMAFLEGIPGGQQHRILAEDLMAEPASTLQTISRWLDLECSPQILDQMLHPERSPYSRTGPYGAEFGFSPSFLESPNYRHELKPTEALNQPLPWRINGEGFIPEVIDLARQLGYDQ